MVEIGVAVNGVFEPVMPVTKIMISNVPSFISEVFFLMTELSRHGRVVSGVKKISPGCKSTLLKHLVSHRRELYMILNNRNEEFNCCLRVKIDNFEYLSFATSFTKCFG